MIIFVAFWFYYLSLLQCTWRKEIWAPMCWGQWCRTRRRGRMTDWNPPLFQVGGRLQTLIPPLIPRLHCRWPERCTSTPGNQRSDRSMTGISTFQEILHWWHQSFQSICIYEITFIEFQVTNYSDVTLWIISIRSIRKYFQLNRTYLYLCGSVQRHQTHTQHQDIHQVVNARPFECCLSTVLHQFGVRTWRGSINC